MYSRFLKQAEKITKNPYLGKAASLIHESGRKLTEYGLCLKDAEKASNVSDLTDMAPERMEEIAGIEEQAFEELLKRI